MPKYNITVKYIVNTSSIIEAVRLSGKYDCDLAYQMEQKLIHESGDVAEVELRDINIEEVKE